VGDSIAFGFGVDRDERYPDLLFEHLRDEDVVDAYENISVTGYTTAQLLTQLRGLDAEGLAQFTEARVIVLSIGGNNILQPFFSHLPDIDTITLMITEVGIIAAEAMRLAADVSYLDEEIKRMREGFSISDIFRIGELLVDCWYEDKLEGLNWPGKVIPTPGHSPGSTCLLLGQDLFSGDTMFAGGYPGRTDLWGGDPAAMQRSLAELLKLPDDTVVWPGHEESSTIGTERGFYG
jgi:hypothetical protein